MKFLSHIKIQTRIILLVLLPLIAVTYLSIERLSKAKQVQSNMQDVETALDFVNEVSPMIVAFQDERNLVRLYLGPGRPDHPVGQEYKQDAENATQQALAIQQRFTRYINANKTQLKQLPKFGQQVEAVLFSLSQFELVRQVAAKRHKSENAELSKKFGRPIWVLAEFNRIIKLLNNSLNIALSVSTKDEQLGKLANAYGSLMYSSDVAIAINSAIDTAITGTMFVHLYGTIAELDAQLVRTEVLFRQNAPSNVLAYYDKTLKKLPAHEMAFAEYRRVREATKLNLIGKKWPLDAQQWKTNSEAIANAYSQIITMMLQEIETLKNQAVEQANNAVYETTALLIILILAIILVSWAIIFSVSKPLKAMVSQFSELARSKDMTTQLKVEGQDELSELAKAFNDLIASFNNTLTGVKGQADAMNMTTGYVAEAMGQSLQLSESQLQATDSVSVAVNEMTATIQEVSSMAQQTSSAVEKAHDVSVKSAQNAELSRDMMQNLTAELGTTSEVVNALNDEAEQISNVLNVIQGIAEQTNLLALNAAIEAARAGEQGRGFAVVADEVRSLAGRTQESTEQIRQQIESLLNGAEAATNKMRSLQEEGNKAVAVVIESSAAFEVMKSELDSIMQMAVQIATAAEEQTCVSNEINERILAIRDDSEKVASHANSTVKSTESLSSNGSQLEIYINEFQVVARVA
ncbi:hypothetical protein C2869_16720 [Saccharobesus litoralis]|uniref:Methyl-accepting chemotaxis protein n=1 Tax=Saccharobesus litoralis TaxID=2172099 RepID=A0A2S0VUV5_9ALTE|nr:methyl-accepting chemotaxis protein [Saccharobesus litoralis]AWB67963.1 hypothetical protein C2869_16720 [Saccharobesus litoralis]